VGVVVASGGSSSKHNPRATGATGAAAATGATGVTSGGQALPGAIPVGNSPDAFASDMKSRTIWTANAGDGTITEINMDSQHAKPFPRYTNDSPNKAAPLVYWQGALWVGDFNAQTVQELNPATGAKMGAPIHVGGQPWSMTTALQTKTFPGYLWVANYNGTLARLSPGAGSGAPMIKSGFASGPKRMAPSNSGNLWVANLNAGSVTTAAEDTGDILGTASVSGSPAAINYAKGKLWVADSTANTVTPFDPVSPTQLTPGSAIRVGRGPRRLTSGRGYLYVSNSGSGSVSRIDMEHPQNPPVTSKVGGYPDAITGGGSLVWVALWSQPTIPSPSGPFPPGGVKQVP
jgi:DNA-binding beta-propeller fold protein YncE